MWKSSRDIFNRYEVLSGMRSKNGRSSVGDIIMKQSYEIAWLCNGKDPKCAGKNGCFYIINNGIRGSCSHTKDIRYALHKKLDPKKNPDRFDKFKYKDQVRYYERYFERS